MENLKTKINTRDASIFVFIGGFTLGILLSTYISISPYLSFLSILLGVTVLIFERILYKQIVFGILLFSILIISLGLGSIRYLVKDHHQNNFDLLGNINEKISIEGVVSEEIERKDNSTKLILKLENGEEKILVSTDLYSHAQYGDFVSVTGKIQKPGIIEGEDGRDFDYGKYLSKDDIYYIISFAKVEIISSGHGNLFKSTLYKIKNHFISKVRDIFPEPESSLLAGLILAGKDTLPKNILDEFRRAGIVHIVVLSGYNVSIVALFFLRSFSFLSLRLAGTLSIIGIILFTLMTGASATMVRASIMAIIFLIGKFVRRDYSATRALLVAGFMMLLQNPKILVFDSSFKLSFLATLALIYATPIIDKLLTRIPERGELKIIISTSIATQIVVLPYLLYSTGNFSVVSLLANILILLIIPLTMLFGFVSTLISFLSTTMAIPFAYITNSLLKWILFVAEWLGNLSFSSFHVRAFPLWIIVLWYLVYFAIWKRSKKVMAPNLFTSQETTGL